MIFRSTSLFLFLPPLNLPSQVSSSPCLSYSLSSLHVPISRNLSILPALTLPLYFCISLLRSSSPSPYFLGSTSLYPLC
jgi:hypothetical protein